MRTLYAASLLLLALVAASPAAAQEEVVPIDREGRIEVVEADLARRAGLWITEYPGFREARLFRGPDGALVLEITEEREGRLLRHRRPTTAAEAEEIRRRISDALAAAPEMRRRQLDQEGRNLLIGQTTLAGLTFYGWALPYALGAEDPATAGGLYLLTSAASFFVPFWLTADQPVTTGMANLSRYGVSRGIVHGLLLDAVIDPGGDEVVLCDPDPAIPCVHEDDDERLMAGLGLATSVAEGVAGYLWARNTRMTAGDAHTVALGGDVGLLTGFLTAVVLDVEDGDAFDTGAAMALAGSGLGILGGRALSNRRDFTWGDAQVMYAGGMTGAWAGGAIAAVADAGEELAAASTLLGGWGGLALTDHAVSSMDFTAGQASLVMLSAFAGALAGAGAGVLVDDADIAAIGSAAGAIGGLVLGYSSFSRDARRGSVVSRGPLDVRLHPEGVLSVLSGEVPSTRPAGLLTLSVRF